jgi:hypothetical protein
MSTNEDNNPMLEQTTPAVSPGNYSPVTVTVDDTVGGVFLGILALILLVGWMRSEARYRKLLAQQKTTNESHSNEK